MSSVFLYYDPVSEFDRLFGDALADRMCSRACAAPTEARRATSRQSDTYRPRLDVLESEDTNTVTATFELPGLTPDSVSIEVHQNRLTVSGDASNSRADLASGAAQPREGERSYSVRERRSGKFARTLQLPVGVKPGDVKAKMENGILTITFPKTLPDQLPKRIAIQ